MKLITIALLAAATLAAAAPAHAQSDVVTIPISFDVENVNRSALACSADGRTYRIRGQIVGPRALLANRARRGLLATLYLHEFSFGRFFWSFSAVPGYDHAGRLASTGHVAVTVDRLGYDDSDHPAGMDTCIGAHADIARQLVAKLKAGDYTAEGGAPRFQRVVLAGHSVGGAVAELAAHSFDDLGIEALVLFAYADQGYSQRTVQQSFAQGQVCLAGGDPAEPGYAYYGQSEADFRGNVFHSAPPEVVAAATAMRNRDPCGDAASLTPATVVNGNRAGAIEEPVLLLFGRNDAVFEPGAGEQQARAFSGSKEVTLREFDNAGHALTLERPAPQVADTMGAWLRERRLVSARPASARCRKARAAVNRARRAVAHRRAAKSRAASRRARKRAQRRLRKAKRRLAARQRERDRACGARGRS
jgi:pimeloyl-ACP methyl ester carboxylesterase